MKCDICGDREAVVFVHQSHRGVKTELRLCAVCAKERGVDRLDGDVTASLSKLLSAVGATKKLNLEKKEATRTCPHCGSSLSDVRKKGLVGCAACWAALGEQLKNAPTSAESSFRAHVGRLPARIAAQKAAEEDAAKLKLLLAAAVKAEDYETAARCRDRLREIEGRGTPRA